LSARFFGAMLRLDFSQDPVGLDARDLTSVAQHRRSGLIRDLFSKVKTGVARSGVSLSEPEAAGDELLDIGARRARRGSAPGGGVLAQ